MALIGTSLFDERPWIANSRVSNLAKPAFIVTDLNFFARAAVFFVMFRSALLLILMLLVAAFAQPAGQYVSRAASSPVPVSQQALAAGACWQHDALTSASSLQNDCQAASACESCKLCHVCAYAVLSAGAVSASAGLALFQTRPTHFVALWLSAEHAPDFKPPIL